MGGLSKGAWGLVAVIACSTVPLLIILQTPDSPPQEAAHFTDVPPMRESHPPGNEEAATWRLCTRGIDGDTIELDGVEKVRLIGVNTPEIHHPRVPVQLFGREAAEFTQHLVLNKRVRLAYDQQPTDRYGRTLAYVYLHDGTFVNAEIIRQGYGFAYTKYPFRYMEDFRALENEARTHERGLWGEIH